MGVTVREGSEGTIYTLLFADDRVLIAQEYEDMWFVVRNLLEYEKWGLIINLEKIYL